MGRKSVKSDFRVSCYHIANEVTGSSFLVEVDGLKVLMDLGMFQSSKHDMRATYSMNLKKNKVPFKDLTHIILGHAHLDHTGLIPVCANENNDFNGIIMTTEPSLPLISLNVRDGAFIMQQECKAYNKKNPNKPLYPLYSMEDAEKVIPMIRGYGFDEKIWLNDKVYVEFIHNGHLFGSASVLLTYVKDEYTNKTLLYTSDTNYNTKQPKPFTKQSDGRIMKPNVVICESTYGNRKHKYIDIEKQLEEYVLEECVKNKRKLFIPAFAIGRSTQILYYLKKIHDKNKEIRDAKLPIYFCGKMMNQSHNIFGNDHYKNYIDEKWHEDYDLFKWGRVKKIDSFNDIEGEVIDNKAGIVIASSGMVTAGYSSYIAENIIGRGNVAYLQMGYMGEGTTGRAIAETRLKDKKTVTIQGKKVVVKAKVLEPISMSGHADCDQLCELVSKGCDNKKLQKVILVHGDDEAKRGLKESMEKALGYNWCHSNGKEIIIPKPHESIKI